MFFKYLEAAITVLREAVAAGVNHINTADFYGPHITNQIIRQALHPYGGDGCVALTAKGIETCFVQDIPAEEAVVVHATQGPLAA